MSIGMHMVMYGGRDDGLFRGAIQQSGGISTLPWETSSSNNSNAGFNNVASKLGCGDAPDKVECIRSLPYQKIFAAVGLAINVPSLRLIPTIDGSLFREHPIKSFEAGRHVKVPTIVGANQDEGSLLIPPGGNPLPNTDNDLKEIIGGKHPTTFADSSALSIFYHRGS